MDGEGVERRGPVEVMYGLWGDCTIAYRLVHLLCGIVVMCSVWCGVTNGITNEMACDGVG